MAFPWWSVFGDYQRWSIYLFKITVREPINYSYEISYQLLQDFYRHLKLVIDLSSPEYDDNEFQSFAPTNINMAWPLAFSTFGRSNKVLSHNYCVKVSLNCCGHSKIWIILKIITNQKKLVFFVRIKYLTCYTFLANIVCFVGRE